MGCLHTKSERSSESESLQSPLVHNHPIQSSRPSGSNDTASSALKLTNAEFNLLRKVKSHEAAASATCFTAKEIQSLWCIYKRLKPLYEEMIASQERNQAVNEEYAVNMVEPEQLVM